MNRIVLFWQRACGKSSVGKELENQTGKPFIDLDAFIVERLWMSIGDFVKQEGEPGWYKFRLAEQEALEAVIRNQENKIISLGGWTIAFSKVRSSLGCVTPERNQKVMRNSWAKRIFLHAEPKILAARIEGDTLWNQNRPALENWQETPLEEATRIYKERTFTYLEQANETINVWKMSITEVVERIIRMYPKIAA